MLELINIGKTFEPSRWWRPWAGIGAARRIRALRGVTLRVERGEVLGLAGPNGAGKTTLLKILSTRLLPTEGRAWVDGVDLVRNPGRVRRIVAFAAADDRGFYWRLTGRQNLEFFAGLGGAPRAESRRRAAAALERVDLRGVADDPVYRYSTGMRQRLQLARVLLAGPQVLLLDEPTRSLDLAAANAFRAIVAALVCEKHLTVVLATHNLDDAEALCRRVAVLDRGVLRELLPAAAVRGAVLLQGARTLAGASA